MKDYDVTLTRTIEQEAKVRVTADSLPKAIAAMQARLTGLPGYPWYTTAVVDTAATAEEVK